jgi:hypothetical protein
MEQTPPVVRGQDMEIGPVDMEIGPVKVSLQPPRRNRSHRRPGAEYVSAIDGGITPRHPDRRHRSSDRIPQGSWDIEPDLQSVQRSLHGPVGVAGRAALERTAGRMVAKHEAGVSAGLRQSRGLHQMSEHCLPRESSSCPGPTRPRGVGPRCRAVGRMGRIATLTGP